MGAAPPALPRARTALDRLVEEHGLEAIVEAVAEWLRDIDAARRPKASPAPPLKRKRGRPKGPKRDLIGRDTRLLLAAAAHRWQTGAAAVWPSLLAVADENESVARRLLRRLDEPAGADLRFAEPTIAELGRTLHRLRLERSHSLDDRLTLLARGFGALADELGAFRRAFTTDKKSAGSADYFSVDSEHDPPFT